MKQFEMRQFWNFAQKIIETSAIIFQVFCDFLLIVCKIWKKERHSQCRRSTPEVHAHDKQQNWCGLLLNGCVRNSLTPIFWYIYSILHCQYRKNMSFLWSIARTVFGNVQPNDTHCNVSFWRKKGLMQDYWLIIGYQLG